MNISLVGRHVELTDTIKEHLNSSIDTLNKFNLDIISVNAVASTQERNGKRGMTVEFTINLSGKNTIVIKQRDDDLYAAIDIAIDRAQKALRRIHDRQNDHQHATLNEAKNNADGSIHLSSESEALEDEIVPVELDLYKPREVGEALDVLKESNKQFEVFIDNENKVRVLFKRNDGRYGLY